jgi:hypothetical protein
MALGMAMGIVARADASPPAAVLGAVTVLPRDADEALFRTTVHHEFEQTLALQSARRRVVVAVTLTRFEPRGAAPSCAVSAVLMDARGGAVLAIADGGAKAGEGMADARPLLRAAVRSAFAQVARAVP